MTRESREQPGTAELDVRLSVSLPYLFFPPRPSLPRPWPVVLFLHGSDERGGGGEELSLVKKWGPPRIAAHGYDLPFAVLAPQCSVLHNWWEFAMPATLIALLDDVAGREPIDLDRVYATGLCAGGAGTMALCAQYPQRIAAGVPVGIEIPTDEMIPMFTHALRDVPFWIFSREADERTPFARCKKLIDQLNYNGSRHARMTVYPGTDHDTWSETYANPDVYAWMLTHNVRERGAG